MKPKRSSACGRFVVFDDLHVDHAVFARLERWASARGMAIEHAIQLALCAFDEPRSPSGREPGG